MTATRAAALLLMLLLAGCSPTTPAETETLAASTGPTASATPTATFTPSSATPIEALDTSGWVTYVSERYGFAIGHPPDWAVEPSQRDWTMEEDAERVDSPGHEAFTSPEGDIRVSVWSTPRNGDESLTTVLAWIDRYCQESQNRPCTDIGSRALELCIERWDCHPGLLVVFAQDVQGFATGGYFGLDITVVAVWREESDGPLPGYGTQRAIAEAFLSTMDVCTPRTDDPIGARGCPWDTPRAGLATGDPLVAVRE